MGKRHIPDWLLERLVLGELPEEEAQRLREALEKEPGGLARLEALEASNKEILHKHPPARVTAEIRSRVEMGRVRRPWKAMAVALPALMAVTMVLVDRIPSPPPAPDDETETIRLKGQSPRLLVHRMGPKGPEALVPGVDAWENDRLQLSYVAAGEPFGVIVSLDGNGAITRHLPLEGDRSVALQQGGRISLSSSYQLDGAPGFERFFLITAEEPFSVRMVLDAVEALSLRSSAQLDDLPLPPRLSQRSFLLRKTQ